MASAAILTRPGRLTPLSLWHLLSLDAPTVATLWTVFAARAFQTPLPPALPPAMFLAVWLLYAADRLLDTAHPGDALQPRHLFARRHLVPFALGVGIAACALAMLVPTLPSSLLRPYLLLAAFLAAWFALIHLTPLCLPKEFVPGLFFAAAVFIPGPRAVAPAILLAALCTLNCLFIYNWEHPLPIHAHPLTRTALLHLQSLTAASALTALIVATPFTFAIALASVALLTLHRHRHHLSPTHLRAAADLALLTPALILPFLP